MTLPCLQTTERGADLLLGQIESVVVQPVSATVGGASAATLVCDCARAATVASGADRTLSPSVDSRFAASSLKVDAHKASWWVRFT